MEMTSRRREAYKSEDWDQYATITEEMGTYRENMHEEVLTEVCGTLEISEEAYVTAHSEAA